MAEFKVKTNGGADPHGKPRVYFCCHPDDFDRYFDKICEDVFKTHNPAIYYTEDMSEPLDETNINVDLGRMNLFLVPITFRLMNEPCRAMAVDIAYAKEKNIPILPFMMESGIDEIYSLPKNFGERQYLSPFSSDTTGISYESKLENYLKSILISDKMAKRVRAAFDAYIFLSYRKKDRRYADELMRIIHNIPGCRDIAIWYDEFLTPGESFMKNIKKAMEDSKLFALLVTPNLLESGNFVMTEEYPMAKKAEMDILPTEMQETDHDELFSKFDGISEPVRADDDHFTETMLSVIKNIAISENDNDPEHNFLIGLAYLDGIDVEVDVERGLELITKAAEADLPEAMEKLCYLYFYQLFNGNHNFMNNKVSLDANEALKWAERLVNYYTKELGEKNTKTLGSLYNLAFIYRERRELKEALELFEKVYDTRCEILSEKHPDTIAALHQIALVYKHNLSKEKALELFKKVYDLRCEVLGETHLDTISSLHQIATIYEFTSDYTQAQELFEKASNIRCVTLGEEHPDTLDSFNHLAFVYNLTKKHEQALDVYNRIYRIQCKIYGEKWFITVKTLEKLGLTYSYLNQFEEAVRLLEKYVIQYELFLCTHLSYDSTYFRNKKTQLNYTRNLIEKLREKIKTEQS